MVTEFEKDIINGLSKTQKQISSKYFYDKVGDKLFVDIMHLPEYYLTDSEMDIFLNKTKELSENITTNETFSIVELGAGDGSKTIHLLRYLLNENYDFEYTPVDISQFALDDLKATLANKLPNLNVKTLQGDYFKVLEKISTSSVPKVVLFLGSNIGNMNDDLAKAFISKLHSVLNKGDKLILGVDIIKSEQIVLPAYNDSKGVTSAFNLNVLHRINNELDADFDLDKFIHKPEYSEETGIAKSYIQSTINQTVTLNKSNKKIHFKAGELIFTEISRKYNDSVINKIFEGTRFTQIQKIYDQKKYFANYIFEKK